MSQCRILKKRKMLGLQTPSCRELELAWRKLHGRKNWVPCAIFACVPSHKLKRPKGGGVIFFRSQCPIQVHTNMFSEPKKFQSQSIKSQNPQSKNPQFLVAFYTFRIHRSVAYNKREELSGSNTQAQPQHNDN